MKTAQSTLVSRALFYMALVFIAYMPFHVFVAQSASLVTGGLEVWKAAKDVVLFLSVPLLLYVSWRRGLWKRNAFRTVLLLGAVYGLLHGLYLLFDSDDHTYSTLVASIYNARLLVYLLLGYMVGASKDGDRYARILWTVAVCAGMVVAIFGLLQYFVLPHDFLEAFGYNVERGVKPLFFIDDKVDLPRIMSTLKDPNSLGAYLIVPLSAAALTFIKPRANKELFSRPLRRGVLAFGTATMALALLLTFSRGALIATIISAVTILYIVTGDRVVRSIKKHWMLGAIILAIFALGAVKASETYVFKNIVFHADDSTVLADPNELRVQLSQNAAEEVIDEPLGHGPGTAGLVSINNPKGGLLTENYYLQIAYEVGWLGALLFLAMLGVVAHLLYRFRDSESATVLLGSLGGYLFYALLIHLWSNEAIACQWWLLSGVTIACQLRKWEAAK